MEPGREDREHAAPIGTIAGAICWPQWNPVAKTGSTCSEPAPDSARFCLNGTRSRRPGAHHDPPERLSHYFASMEPGREDREHDIRARSLSHSPTASMEPGREDREHSTRSPAATCPTPPQWNPVAKTGSTGMCVCEARHPTVRLNGTRSRRPGAPSFNTKPPACLLMLASMEPGREDREHGVGGRHIDGGGLRLNGTRSRRPGAPVHCGVDSPAGRVASMEPGREDREHLAMSLRSVSMVRAPQWNPVAKTGSTESWLTGSESDPVDVASMEPGREDREHPSSPSAGASLMTAPQWNPVAKTGSTPAVRATPRLASHAGLNGTRSRRPGAHVVVGDVVGGVVASMEPGREDREHQ